MNKYIWVASHHSFDDEGTNIKASESLANLQTFVMKRAEKLCKRQGAEYEVHRFRHHNAIYIQLRVKGDPLSPVEWFTIKRVTVL